MDDECDETNTSPTDQKLAVDEQRPASAAGDLCYTCDQVFCDLLWPERVARYAPEEEQYGNWEWSSDESERLERGKLGWLDRMQKTCYCAMCRFCVALFDDTSDLAQRGGAFGRVSCHMNVKPQSEHELGPSLPLWWTGSMQGGSSKRVRLDWDLSLSFIDSGERVETEDGRFRRYLPMDGANFCLEIDSAVKLRHPLGRLCNAIIEESTTAPKTSLSFHHLGRAIPERVSANWIRESYAVCQRYHALDCDSQTSVLGWHGCRKRTIDVVPLRAIDVDNMCIVELPAGARYVALSYTWTTQPYLAHLQSNATHLERRRSLESDSISPTIRDSMEVVKMLGEKYLWADRFCIIQDSDDDKRIQIRNMADVYRNAALTIIAAGPANGDSDKGLAGIELGSRTINQPTTDIRGLRFLATCCHLDKNVRSQRWASRAWTYQESVLSKRNLIFTEVGAAFCCRKDVQTEDYVRELRCSCWSKEPGRISLLCGHYQTPHSTDDILIHGFDPSIWSYEEFVCCYTARQMSVTSDIQNAAHGLLVSMHEETGHEMLCGMPRTNLLNHFLVWLPGVPSIRRGSISSDTLFPSWSWTGWIGTAAYPCNQEQFKGQKELEFDEIPLIDRYDILIPARDGSTSKVSHTEALGDSTSIVYCHLSFSAPTAAVTVSTKYWGDFTDARLFDQLKLSKNYPSSCCQQLVVNNEWSGLVLCHTDQDLADLAEQCVDFREVDEIAALRRGFIALSTTYDPWGIWLPLGYCDEENYGYADEDGERHPYLPWDCDVWGKENTEVVNILLIEQCGEIYERRGIGQIHIDAWRALNPVDRDIILG